ncbi:hypothetical protein B4N89_18445 [Embleya scabrispora]|uniref:Uncharacterized protein n=1 Tax=Embleya scabrispora TaxID=159449 RepID=A0A1T3P0N1_9ACTN|nr:hypothetical protein B4N89_18445 [Embleya scabrispora]
MTDAADAAGAPATSPAVPAIIATPNDAVTFLLGLNMWCCSLLGVATATGGGAVEHHTEAGAEEHCDCHEPGAPVSYLGGRLARTRWHTAEAAVPLSVGSPAGHGPHTVN